jgi:hypothetical protein
MSDIRGIPQPRHEEPLTETKRVRLSPSDVKAQESAARDAGMTWSEMVRWLFNSYLGKPVNPPVLPWVPDADKR